MIFINKQQYILLIFFFLTLDFSAFAQQSSQKEIENAISEKRGFIQNASDIFKIRESPRNNHFHRTLLKYNLA